jgi:hypothetical protein
MHLSGYSTDEAEGLFAHQPDDRSEGTGGCSRHPDRLARRIIGHRMSIVSAMNEFRLHRPDMKPSALVRAGMKVGKDMTGRCRTP